MHVSYTGTTIREHGIIYFEDMAVSLFCKGWKVCLSSHLLHQESSGIGFLLYDIAIDTVYMHIFALDSDYLHMI